MSDHYKALKCSRPSYWIVITVLIGLIISGYAAAHYIEHNGHWVTGMNNQIVWGLPHVFVIALILAASGTLNIASISSVFDGKVYTPWARLSALLSVCLLLGGLIVLVLDLGRPERLIVAITHYNFKSIFAWNIFLYTGFIVVVAIYLWVMFERRMNRHAKKIGLIAFVWRLVLTSGTGSIFGFLVARQFYDAAMMIPIFIALSLILGSATFIVVSSLVSHWAGCLIQEKFLVRLTRLMAMFIVLELFLVAVFHLTNLYIAEHHGVEKFILRNGGLITALFWIGQILLGGIVPLWIIYISEFGSSVKGMLVASALIILGALSQLYVTVIGGQAYPMELFPGKSVSSSFFDGAIASYSPSTLELMLGLGGVALSLLLVLAGMRILPFLPDIRGIRHD